MLRGACYSKWPNGKTEGFNTCTREDVCACVHLPRGAVVQRVKGDDAAIGRIRGVVHCNRSHNETAFSRATARVLFTVERRGQGASGASGIAAR